MMDLKRAYKDFPYWCSCLRVPNKEGGRRVPFKLKPEQEKIAADLASHKKIVVLKARQIGVSTLLAAWNLHRIFFASEPISLGVVSHLDKSAQHILGMSRAMLKTLPKEILATRTIGKDSVTTLSFSDSGASITAATAEGKSGAGRSFTFQGAHLTEFDFYKDQASILQSIMDAVGDGQIVIETTINAPGSYYESLVKEAQAGSGGCPWHLCFSPWFADPTYSIRPPITFQPTAEERANQTKYNLSLGQLAWYRSKIEAVGTDQASLVRREYPSSIEEAFQVAKHSWLSESEIGHILSIPKLMTPPQKSFGYAMGMDIGQGVGGDYSAIAIVCRETHEPVCIWRSNTLSIERSMEKAGELYYLYGKPKTIIESNSIGQLAIYLARKQGILNVPNEPWVTSTKSKLPLLEGLRMMLPAISTLPSELLVELRSMVSVDGKAPSSPTHDDMVMALALAYQASGIIQQGLPSAGLAPRGIMHRVQRRLAQQKAREIREGMGGLVPWR